MTIRFRLLSLAALWLIAGIVCAVFAKLTVEAGTDEELERAKFVLFAPLEAAQGLAFVVIPGGYNAWPGRQVLELVASAVFLMAFIAHAVVALTRTERHEFARCIVVQVVMLSASVISVLYLYHWDSIHMHG